MWIGTFVAKSSLSGGLKIEECSNPCFTCVKVVLCLRLAGVGQEDEGAWEGAWTEDMPPASPSVFSFLKAPSEL